jgi:hypothetical protein
MNKDSDYSLVLECTKKLEAALELNYGATGRGLGEKAISIRDIIGKDFCKKLLFLSTIRNKLLHEPDFILDDNTKKSFSMVCSQCKIKFGVVSQAQENDRLYDESLNDVYVPESKDWREIKMRQRLIYNKMKYSIIPIVIIFLAILMFLNK